jgi:hypothetical protein
VSGLRWDAGWGLQHKPIRNVPGDDEYEPFVGPFLDPSTDPSTLRAHAWAAFLDVFGRAVERVLQVSRVALAKWAALLRLACVVETRPSWLRRQQPPPPTLLHRFDVRRHAPPLSFSADFSAQRGVVAA